VLARSSSSWGNGCQKVNKRVFGHCCRTIGWVGLVCRNLLTDGNLLLSFEELGVVGGVQIDE